MGLDFRQTGWILFCLLTLAPLAAARDNSALPGQRADFKAAEQALARGDLGRYQRLKSSLRDYPLYPYLEYRELRRRLHRHKSSRIESFLTRYADTPLAGLLRNAWLDHLARRGRWQGYLAFYRPSGKTERQCHYLRALMETGREREALQQVEPLWLHGRSQPRACDPVFAAWREAGLLTEELVWRRIQLAMDAHQTRLARYLRRFLPKDQHIWLDRWLRVHRKPQRILSAKDFSGRHPYRNSILLHGIRRFARKDATAAHHAWRLLQERHAFTPEQRLQAERTLAFALIRDKHPDTLTYLARIRPAEGDLALAEARIRAALQARNWTRALAWLSELPEAERMSEGWRYWRGRALEALGRAGEAARIYRQLARERSYYGFLAADRQGSPYHLANIPLRINDPALKKQLANLPAIRRAEELHALGRLVEARREWEAITRDMNHEELRAAAKLAQGWGWHDRAIFSLARTGYWDDLDLRFPLAYRSQIETQAGAHRLDSAWIFAVLRQESAFIRDARSHAGAIGLMQLMPRTARQLSTRLNGRSLRSVKSLLLQPDANIELGARYLRRILDKLDQHPVLATAAYNAGPYRVKKWLPDEDVPADLWVETIPFKETRSYLQRVFAYTIIYEQQLGLKPTRLRHRMPPVKGIGNLAINLPDRQKFQTAQR
ncbi:MAG TPA: murein transglycosylase [Sedimenticola sp.]|nr:murein transglycosylase [Sedimenticola sp.]